MLGARASTVIASVGARLLALSGHPDTLKQCPLYIRLTGNRMSKTSPPAPNPFMKPQRPSDESKNWRNLFRDQRKLTMRASLPGPAAAQGQHRPGSALY